MKNILIIHAHPEPKSFSSAIKDVICDEFQKAENEVRIVDLYDINFNPVASKLDFIDRKNSEYLNYALEQRNSYQSSTLSSDIKEQIDHIEWADLIIFNFPIYWFSVPAILKGWIDRVLISGPIYGGLRFYDKGGLVGKKAWPIFTLGGQPHMFGENSVHGELFSMLSHFLRGTLGYVGLQVYTPFVAYHVPYITQENREDILSNLRNEIKDIKVRTTLPFQSLKHFDEKLYPIS